MPQRPLGIVLLAGALLQRPLVGIAAFVAVLPRSSNTSPLAALFALMWSGAYFVTAILTRRCSPLAPLAFLAAIGLLLFPASFLFPGSQLAFPSFIVVALIGVLGYRYLRTAHVKAAPVPAEQASGMVRLRGTRDCAPGPATSKRCGISHPSGVFSSATALLPKRDPRVHIHNPASECFHMKGGYHVFTNELCANRRQACGIPSAGTNRILPFFAVSEHLSAICIRANRSGHVVTDGVPCNDSSPCPRTSEWCHRCSWD